MDSDKHDLTALNLSSSNKINIDIQNEESAKRREALARRPSYRKILNDLSSTSEEFIHASVTAAAGNPPYEEDNNNYLKNISPAPYTGGNRGGGGRKRGGVVRGGKNESGGVKRRLNNFTLAAANNDENVVVENSTTPLMTFSSPTYKDYPEPILRSEKFSPPPSNKNHRQEQQYPSDHHQFLPLPPSYLTPERKWLSTPSIFNSVGPNGRNDYSGAAYTPDHVHPSGSSPPPDYVNASGGGTPSSSSSFYLNVNHQRRSHHHHQTLEALSRSPQSSSNLSDYHQLQHYGNVVRNQSQQHDSITSEVGLQPFINEAASYGSPPRKHLQQQFLNSSPHPNHLSSPSVTDFRFPAHVISTPFENNNEQQLQQHQDRKVAQFSSPQQHSTPPLSTQRFKEEFYNPPAPPPPDNATTSYNNPPYAGGGTVSASFPPAAAAAYQHILQRQLLYHQLAAAASLYPHPHLHHHPVGSAVTGLFAAPPSLTPQTLGVRAALVANGSSDISKFPTPSPSEGGNTDTPAKGIIFPERLLSLANNAFPPSPTSHNYNYPHHPPLYHHPSPVSPPLPVYVKREPTQQFEPTATVRPPSIPVSSNSFPYPTPTAAPQHTQPPPMNNSRVPVVLFNNNNRKSASSPLTTITTTLNHNSVSHRNRHNRSGESNHSNNATNSTHSSYSSSRSQTTPRSLKSSPHPTTTTSTKQTPYSSHQGYTSLVNDSFGNDSLVGRPHDLSSQRTHHQSHYTEITGPAGTYSENFGGNNCNKQLNSGIAKTDHYEYSLSPNNNLLSGNVSSFSGLPSSSFLISPLQQQHSSVGNNTAGSLFTTQIGDTASASAVLGYNPNSSSTSNTYLEGSGGSHHLHHHPLVEEAARKREVRLLKNREAAKECRRKKKEYVKCLENRVAVLENQNKALIEELKALKELYCLKQE